MTSHAKTKLLMIPANKSHGSARSIAWMMKPAVSNPNANLHTLQPPTRPTQFPNTVSTGSMTSIARNRGTTRKRTGLIAITSSASISSPTFIVPNSAVTAEPLRPITITAISSGPSSRNSDTETSAGM